MAQSSVVVKVSLAWWFPILVGLLAPFGRLGIRMPDRFTEWVAGKAAKVKVV